ncbi:MAG: SigB/SigF/SigG family RNA polymerase sigma factor [Actinobacteria bacterium]|nr:SigB/SigF/SigG family RNA polymerase sigma factor [Actinomycetota bacterium]
MSGAERRAANRAEATKLLTELHQLPADAAERSALRERLVELHLPLVEHLARRFTGRNEPLPDLVQVGSIGLLKSIDRFEPERGLEFSTYATPTILGEIKRYFRDAGWLVRVPRRAQELQTTIARARADLSQELHRAPTVNELASRIGADADEVIEALDVSRAYAGLPLEALAEPGRDPSDSPIVGIVDEGLEQVEQRALLRPALDSLPERERRILLLRFVAGKTQTEIADIVGVSQMQVSRLVARSLAQLRERLDAPPAAE